MMTSDHAKALFRTHLPSIERTLDRVGRRCGFRFQDLEDFSGWAKLRMIENDYQVLRRFRGKSHIATYLNTVISNLARDYRNRLWGRWRPSAAARRLGPAAERLERLVYRDGFSSGEAIQIFRSAADVGESEEELERLLERIPSRLPRRKDGPELLESMHAEGRVDRPLIAHEDRNTLSASTEVLSRALVEFPQQDRLLLQMRFEQGLRVADIARCLRLPRRCLYRRFEGMLRRLRRRLEQQNLSKGTVLAALARSASAGRTEVQLTAAWRA